MPKERRLPLAGLLQPDADTRDHQHEPSLSPPRTGDLLRVPVEFLDPPTFCSLTGSIRLEIDDALPWNGLVDETKAFPGLLTSFVGGIDLGNEPLD